MSDDLNRPREQEDEVEAHHAHPKLGANAEAGDEAGSDDEVEAHHHPKLARPR